MNIFWKDTSPSDLGFVQFVKGKESSEHSSGFPCLTPRNQPGGCCVWEQTPLGGWGTHITPQSYPQSHSPGAGNDTGLLHHLWSTWRVSSISELKCPSHGPGFRAAHPLPQRWQCNENTLLGLWTLQAAPVASVRSCQKHMPTEWSIWHFLPFWKRKESKPRDFARSKSNGSKVG